LKASIRSFQILPATDFDFERIRFILQESKLVYSDLDPQLPHFFVALSNLELIGCIGLEIYGTCGLLRSLWVDPAQRNQGTAKALVNKLEQYAGELNLSDLYLLTETAEAFFINIGYQGMDRGEIPKILKSSAEFSSLCPATAKLMTKKLNTPLVAAIS